MLTITVGDEVFDQEKNEFRLVDAVHLQFEHSLVSLSKWESKYEKPFLSDKEKTNEEVMDYLRFMLLTPDVEGDFLQKLSAEQLQELTSYISSKQSATWFNERPGGPKNREVITSEIIYYWMVSLEIPFECQYWHLNRLMTLIKVINQKNAPKKKMSASEQAAQRRALNEARRKQYNTKG